MKNALLISGFILINSILQAYEPQKAMNNETGDQKKNTLKIRAADISFLPMLEENGVIFYNQTNEKQNALEIFQNEGMNTARLRVWKKPEEKYSSLPEVKKFSERLKSKGMKIWITVHYSDTWADPGSQTIPSEWQGISFDRMRDSVYNYTCQIMKQVQPDIIQIGNEINNGFLWPYGRLDSNEAQFRALLSEGIRAVRDTDPSAQIMLHYAGTEGARWFFNKMRSLDYDLIGISYYPKWHGKDLEKLEFHLEGLKEGFQKKTVIAETAYPFTLEWDDNTNNIAGANDVLILPQFPASKQGQKDFLLALKDIAVNSGALGFCYWAPEWVTSQKTGGTPWENQALFDFNYQAVPAIDVFNE